MTFALSMLRVKGRPRQPRQSRLVMVRSLSEQFEELRHT
jgi:hypothetical protein